MKVRFRATQILKRTACMSVFGLRLYGLESTHPLNYLQKQGAQHTNSFLLGQTLSYSGARDLYCPSLGSVSLSMRHLARGLQINAIHGILFWDHNVLKFGR